MLTQPVALVRSVLDVSNYKSDHVKDVQSEDFRAKMIIAKNEVENLKF
jgi:hypothetical protein